MSRRIVTLVASLGAGLVLPPVALATITELGASPPTSTTTGPTKTQTTGPGTPAPSSSSSSPSPSCPSTPCVAVSRVTGFQVRAGSAHNFVVVPRDGWIVAWTISLGKPDSKQTAFFNTAEGGLPSAGIAILQVIKVPSYRLLAASPIVPLQRYLGKTAQFPLAHSIAVKKGEVVALNVPTWAPALAVGLAKDSNWRASRSKASCNDTTTPATHTTIGSVKQYACLYSTARLTYSATLISTP